MSPLARLSKRLKRKARRLDAVAAHVSSPARQRAPAGPGPQLPEDAPAVLLVLGDHLPDGRPEFRVPQVHADALRPVGRPLPLPRVRLQQATGADIIQGPGAGDMEEQRPCKGFHGRFGPRATA